MWGAIWSCPCFDLQAAKTRILFAVHCILVCNMLLNSYKVEQITSGWAVHASNCSLPILQLAFKNYINNYTSRNG